MSPAPTHEYLVVPAPRRAPRIKGVRDPAERFAVALAEVMNEAGRDGWEYLRTDALPMEARSGWLGGRTVTTQDLLVFRRPAERPVPVEAPAPTFERTAAEEPRVGGAVTPLAPRPAPARPPADRSGPPPDEEDGDPEGGPSRPRLGGARRD